MIHSIIKRDGRVVLYDQTKIAEAILRAMEHAREGNAADAYRAKFAALQSAMDTINRMIMEHSTDLEQMAQVYMDAESQNASLIDSLPASTL